MAQIALYRKYRPNKWKEVLGQNHVVKVLESEVKQDNISHAYLFSGSRGTGKTSVARIFARDIGTSDKDLYEIDAASNRGIDDVRELREAVNTFPFDSKYKVYIVDEAHMLTTQAFNALLKTLEEPPEHVVFILATTEMHKLPDTVISRCEPHHFKQPSRDALKGHVIDIAKKEGFTLEPSSADLIAILAEGSFRDAQGILQKILSSSSDKKVSVDEVIMVTAAPKASLVNGFVKALDEKDAKEALETVSKAVAGNVDVKVFLKLVLHKLRAVLLLRFAPDMKGVLEKEFSAEDFELLESLAKKTEPGINSRTLYEMLEAYNSTGRSYIPQLPIELGIVKLMSDKTNENN